MHQKVTAEIDAVEKAVAEQPHRQNRQLLLKHTLLQNLLQKLSQRLLKWSSPRNLFPQFRSQFHSVACAEFVAANFIFLISVAAGCFVSGCLTGCAIIQSASIQSASDGAESGQPKTSNNPEESRMDVAGSPDRQPLSGRHIQLNIPNNSKRIDQVGSELLVLERAYFPAPGAISVGRDGQVVGWPVPGKPGVLLARPSEALDAVNICHDGSRIAVSDKGGTRILSTADYSVLAQLNSIKSRIAALAFSPTCDSVLLGGNDGMIYRWRFGEWTEEMTYEDREKLLERYVGHSVSVGSVAFHPFGRIFFSGDWNGSLNAWLRYDSDAFGGQYDKSLTPGMFFTGGVERMRVGVGAGDDVNSIRISSDGQLLLLSLQSGLLEIWKVRGLKKVCAVQAHKGIIFDAEFTADEKGVLSIGRDGHLKRWQITRVPDLAGGPDNYSLVVDRDVIAGDVRAVAPWTDDAVAAGTKGGEVRVVGLKGE